MSSEGTSARRGAIALLGAVLGDRRMLSDSLGLIDRYNPAERARAQRLANDTLRWLENADRILSPFLQRPPPLFVHNALRLGTFELCNGEAAHGAVNDLVSVVGRHKKYAKFKGLTNAVLRKAAAEGPAKWPLLSLPRLPKALRKQFVAAWGVSAVAQMEAVHVAKPPLDLTPRGDAAGLAALVGGQVLPTGSVRLTDPGAVSALPGYAEGQWWVQDAAAAIPARVLAAQPGMRVLDMCAAPGGKTMQLAAAGAEVTALDLSESRLTRVAENLERTGLTARLIAADARTHTEVYDAVLLDAPCSATGTIRRHPDLPYIKASGGLAAILSLQSALLDQAWTCVAKGGTLVYCTCSLLPEEGEAQASAAMSRLDGAQLDTSFDHVPGVESHWTNGETGLRLRPDFWADQGGMDGFFVARFRKTR